MTAHDSEAVTGTNCALRTHHGAPIILYTTDARQEWTPGSGECAVESAPFFKFPQPSSFTLWLAAMGFILLLFVAVLLERMRQARSRKERLAVAWRNTKAFVDDKELSEKEWGLLEALIRRWSPTDPHRVVSLHHEFEICVENEMERLRAKGSSAQYREIGLLLRDIRVKLGLDYVPLGQRIYSTRELRGGQRLLVSRASEDRPTWWRAAVVRIDEAHFRMTATKDELAKAGPLKRGLELRCRMWRDEDARYVFTVPFVGHEEEPPALILDHTTDLKRLQSRAYFRVRHEQAAMVGFVDARDDTGDIAAIEAKPVITRLRGHITNISAGGLALVIHQAVPRHVMLRVPIELDDAESLRVHAQVVDASPLAGGRYLVRGSYVGIDDETRDAIARHVARRQLPPGHPDEQAE
jgi:c-di-GMP-binding flagellar brake protein YcgR